jgi:hypothetical protein
VYYSNPRYVANRARVLSLRNYVVVLLLLALLFSTRSLTAQPALPKHFESTDLVHQFPLERMWDDAVNLAKTTNRSVLVFDVDYVDTNSIYFRDSVLGNPAVKSFVNANFILALNDFSVDPPLTVGFDSLRHLGQRLSGLEELHHIVLRPTALLLRADSTEIDRITLPNKLTPTQFIDRLKEIVAGRNTLGSAIATFWQDTLSIANRITLVNAFEERSMYDSVIRHLDVIRSLKAYPAMAQEAGLKYGYMRLKVEGKVVPLMRELEKLGHTGADSITRVTGLSDIIQFFVAKKRIDSAAKYYQKIFDFTGKRDPDLLNDYAWQLNTYSHLQDSALALVNEAILQNSQEPNYYDTRAKIQFYRNERKLAVEDEKKAYQFAATEDKEWFQKQVDYYVERVNGDPPEKTLTPKTTPAPAVKEPKKRHK